MKSTPAAHWDTPSGQDSPSPPGRARYPWARRLPRRVWPGHRRRELRRPYGGIDFVIVDVETTGWSPADAAITEIGAVRVSGGRVRAQFSSLVNPGGAIPPQVTELTGISDAMAATAPPPAGVLGRFLAFSQGSVLTAHNAPFDIGFLRAACVASGLRWPKFPVIDTVELARLVLAEDEVPDRKLATLAGYFGAGTPPRHRALADALATADVLGGLLARLSTAGIETLAQAGCGRPRPARSSSERSGSEGAGPARAAVPVPAMEEGREHGAAGAGTGTGTG